MKDGEGNRGPLRYYGVYMASSRHIFKMITQVPMRLELMTFCLLDRCSTTELWDQLDTPRPRPGHTLPHRDSNSGFWIQSPTSSPTRRWGRGRISIGAMTSLQANSLPQAAWETG